MRTTQPQQTPGTTAETWSFAQIELVLKNGTADERTAGARQLERFGSRGVGVLCGALRDRSGLVRIAAAECLRRVGDQSAIGPLRQALRRDVRLPSRRRTALLAGMAVTLLLAVLLSAILGFGGFVEMFVAAFLGPPLLALLAFTSNYAGHRAREQRSQACRAYAEALAGIAERHPASELRAAVQDLKIAGKDLLWNDATARSASRYALHRIEALTQKSRSMPLASEGAVSTENTLPRTARAVPEQPQTLPRAAAGADLQPKKSAQIHTREGRTA